MSTHCCAVEQEWTLEPSEHVCSSVCLSVCLPLICLRISMWPCCFPAYHCIQATVFCSTFRGFSLSPPFWQRGRPWKRRSKSLPKERRTERGSRSLGNVTSLGQGQSKKLSGSASLKQMKIWFPVSYMSIMGFINPISYFKERDL